MCTDIQHCDTQTINDSVSYTVVMDHGHAQANALIYPISITASAPSNTTIIIGTLQHPMVVRL